MKQFSDPVWKRIEAKIDKLLLDEHHDLAHNDEDPIISLTYVLLGVLAIKNKRNDSSVPFIIGLEMLKREIMNDEPDLIQKLKEAEKFLRNRDEPNGGSGV